jgi:hypothetical protein
MRAIDDDRQSVVSTTELNMSRFFVMSAGAAALSLSLVAAPASATSSSTAYNATTYAATSQKPITLAEVQAAQRAWGDALVAISAEYERNGREAATRLAGQVLDTAYGYNLGTVLFKPTLTTAPQTFRYTREGALAYFVGGNRSFPGDTGFALKNWRSVRIDNKQVILTGNTAMSMGNVSMTDASGKVTTVDKTWGYVRDKDGQLRIVLHHSSLPYAAN